MDPVTVDGLKSSAVQITSSIEPTIQGFHSLKGTFKNADTTIRLLISQLSTIKAALNQLRDWAEFNSDGSPKGPDFMRGTRDVLCGCQALMEILFEEVEGLITLGGPSNKDVPIEDMMGSARTGWNEAVMRKRQETMSRQAQALQLLLTAAQCSDITSQSHLLGLKENRKLVLSVVEDTKSLREPQVSVAPQIPESGQSSSRTQVHLHSQTAEKLPSRVIQPRRRWSTALWSNPRISTPPNPGKLPTRSSQEFYEAINSRSPTKSSIFSDPGPARLETSVYRPAGVSNPVDRRHSSVPRTRSSVSIPTVSDQFLRRWLSTSKLEIAQASAEIFPPSLKAFHPVPLSRFNTSRSTLKADPFEASDSNLCSTRSRRKIQQSRARQSTGFCSVNALEAPAIVQAAQIGSGDEVTTLLGNGDDIEASHLPTKRTALSVACHCGHDVVVDILIQHGAKVETRDMDRSTPLHLAASSGHYNVIQLLLNEKANIEVTDAKKRTPLWFAAAGGHTASVDLLLKNGAKVNTRADDQLTPLHAAAKACHKAMTALLLRNYAHIEARDVNIMTALHYACEGGHISVVDVLIRKGANIEAVGKDATRPLMFAAASGHLKIVELLVKKKASLQSTDYQGDNAMHWAARNGHHRVVEFLLEQKLSIDVADNNGLTPLHLAVIGSHFGAVDFILKQNASVEARCQAGETALHYACDSDDADIVRLLLEAGANAEAETNDNKRRPIHIAAASGSVETIGILYQHGVEMAARDSAGFRPLCIACNHGQIDVVKLLLSLKEPLIMPIEGRPYSDSPLCVAAKAGHVKVVELLIRRGALVKQRDEHGFIALHYATYYGHLEIVKLLLDAGAEPLEDETFVTTQLSGDSTLAAESKPNLYFREGNMSAPPTRHPPALLHSSGIWPQLEFPESVFASTILFSKGEIQSPSPQLG